MIEQPAGNRRPHIHWNAVRPGAQSVTKRHARTDTFQERRQLPATEVRQWCIELRMSNDDFHRHEVAVKAGLFDEVEKRRHVDKGCGRSEGIRLFGRATKLG